MTKKPKHERIESDFYSTPLTAVWPLLHSEPWIMNYAFEKSFFEPAWGSGAIAQAIEQFMYLFSKPMTTTKLSWFAVDIEERPHVCEYPPDIFWQQDFVTNPPTIGRRDGFISITNPSFKLSQAYVDLCRKMTKTTILLLPLGFLGSQGRSEWWQSNTPDLLLPLSERPKFAHNGSDKMDYAWYIWDAPLDILAKDRFKILPPWAETAEKEYLCPASKKSSKGRSKKSSLLCSTKPEPACLPRPTEANTDARASPKVQISAKILATGDASVSFAMRPNLSAGSI
jgi:hypothetical protein